MKRRGRNGGRGYDPGQLHIEWSTTGSEPVSTTSPLPASSPVADTTAAPDAPSPLIQYLPWDFKMTFPRPTARAIKAGVIADEDTTPQAIRAIHGEHAREALRTLRDLDAVLNARRRGIDPGTGRPPQTQAGREELQQRLNKVAGRLEHAFAALMDTYGSAFGQAAQEAFTKAVRAWHGGIEVASLRKTPPPSDSPAAKEPRTHAETSTKPQVRRNSRGVVARLPVPRPLPSAIAAGRFGQEENGKPIRPGAHEVRAITERHAEKLIDLLDSIASAPADAKDAKLWQFMASIADYAEDFGQHAALQLEAYVRRQATLDPNSRQER
jgi:hypothetical protein